MTLTASARENTDNDDRSATVMISCGTELQTVSVTQKGAGSWLLTPDCYEIGPEGGLINLAFARDRDLEYTFSKDGSDWIRKKNSRIATEYPFAISPNPGPGKRECTIIIGNWFFREKVRIFQSGTALSNVLSDDTCRMIFEGGLVKVRLRSDAYVSWQVVNGQDWISCSEEKTVSTSEIVFSVSSNSIRRERTAVIEFTDCKNGNKETVTVIQEAFREQPDNEVWYTTSTGQKLRIYKDAPFFDARIESVSYENGRGIIRLEKAPERILMHGVRNSIFNDDCSILTSISLPTSLRTIEYGSMMDLFNLIEIVIPEGVDTIRENAFYGCNSLERIVLPSTLNWLESAFLTSNIKEFSGPCKYIIDGGKALTSECDFYRSGDTAYHHAVLVTNVLPQAVSLVIPDGIGGLDFGIVDEDYKLESVHIPSSTVYIDQYTICSRSFRYIDGPNATDDHRCLVIDGELVLFAPAGLKSYKTPSCVTSIRYGAMYGYELEEVTVGESVSIIDDPIFYTVPNLKTIHFPQSLTKFNGDAINNLSYASYANLTNIYLHSAVPPEITEYEISYHLFDSTTVNVPEESYSLYCNAEGWKNCQLSPCNYNQ